MIPGTGIKVSVHDLRRTFKMVAAMARVGETDLHALTNHTLPNTVVHDYLQLTAENPREPVQQVAEKLKKPCKIEQPDGDSVVNIARQSNSMWRSVMPTVMDHILGILGIRPKLTAIEIAQELFGPSGTQQRMNYLLLTLISRGQVRRSGYGGQGDPFRYELA